jgi:hypothetical protein
MNKNDDDERNENLTPANFKNKKLNFVLEDYKKIMKVTYLLKKGLYLPEEEI